MGIELVQVDCNGSDRSVSGKVVNVYGTYENALLFDSAGLLTNVREFDTVTDEAKGIISQIAKLEGPKVNIYGILIFAIDTSTAEVFLMSTMSKWGGPRRKVVLDVGSDLNTQSTSSSSSLEFDSFSSSSSSSSSLVFIPSAANFNIRTTDISATWSPTTVTKTGNVLNWTVYKASDATVLDTDAANDPTLDFSASGADGWAEAVSTDGFSGLTVLDVNGESITEFIGLPNLTALTSLICNNNDISILDVSQLTSLITLSVGANNISVLNVTSLTSLTELTLVSNNVSILDVGSMTSLTKIACNNNDVSVLDLSSLVLLNDLACNNNNISVLDVSSLTQMTSLKCNNNSNLSVLDVSSMALLVTLFCTDNNISILDVSSSVLLTNCLCQNNTLSASQLDNVLTSLDSHGLSGGSLNITNNTTSYDPDVGVLASTAAQTAYDNLIGKSWTITF